MKNPLDVPPIRPAPLPNGIDGTGEADESNETLADSEAPPPAPAGVALPVEFLGDARQYARLWYVCLFLTVVTAGIYSAWAKVRLRRYLRSHLLVGGVPMVYHGAPGPILRGRLLAAAILVTAYFLQRLYPAAGPWLIVVIILAAPWLLLQLFRFDAANHSWRGIRFGFAARYRDALWVFLPLLVWPASDIAMTLARGDRSISLIELLIPVLLYAFLWPVTISAITRLRFEGATFGTAQSVLRATTYDFYNLYFRGMGWVFVALISANIVIFTLFATPIRLTLGADVLGALKLLFFVSTMAYAVGYARSRRFNLGLHRLTVDGRIRFRSSLQPEQFARLGLRNALWSVATLGLAIPWRRIVTLRMQAAAVTVYVDGGLDGIRQADSTTHSALGESVAEGLNIDLSL